MNDAQVELALRALADIVGAVTPIPRGVAVLVFDAATKLIATGVLCEFGTESTSRGKACIPEAWTDEVLELHKRTCKKCPMLERATAARPA